MKIGLRYYFHPTPKIVKKLADSFLVAIGGGGALATLSNFYPTISAGLTLTAIVAKLASNFCANERKKSKTG